MEFLIKPFAVFGAIVFVGVVGMIIAWGPQTYRVIRDDIRQNPPNWLINWRIRKHRIRTWVRFWFHYYSTEQVNEIMLIIGILCATYLGLIIFNP